MLIKRKIMLICTVVTVFTILFSSILLHIFLKQNIMQLEKTEVSNDLERIAGILQYDINMLKSFSLDWATWNDTYQFVQDRNEKYIDDNLGSSSFSLYKLDGMIYLDKSGKAVFSKWYDLKSDKEIPLPAFQQEIINLSSRNNASAGIIKTNSGLIMIAAAPIFDSRKEKPSEGLFIAVRFLDNEKFSELLRLPVKFAAVNEKNNQTSFAVNQAAYGEITPTFTASDDKITASVVLNDINGQAAFSLETENPRDIYKNGLALVKMLLLLVCGFGVLVGSIGYWLNNKYIVKRLESLAGQISEITSFENMPQKLSIEGHDEITKIADNTTSMMHELKSVHDRLEYVSNYDMLTGLYNRTYFEKYLNYLEMHSEKSNVGVIVCDVDGLKLANDMFGQEYGDNLLREFAAILNEVCLDALIKARTGGDEFIILLEESDALSVSEICQKLRQRLEVKNTNQIGGLSVAIGFEAGGPAVSIKERVKKADNQMHREKLHRTQSRSSALVHTLRSALEARDYITEGHAHRLGELVALLAEKMGLPQADRADLVLFAEFHDVGKIGISDNILFKKGALTPEERQEMNKHCEIGYRIAKSTPALAPIADLILRHHERYDGKGYPLQLVSDEIPIECRILAIVDTFDAMTNDRPYRKALSEEVAVAELRACSGTQFDPRLVELFLEVLKENKAS